MNEIRLESHQALAAGPLKAQGFNVSVRVEDDAPVGFAVEIPEPWQLAIVEHYIAHGDASKVSSTPELMARAFWGAVEEIDPKALAAYQEKKAKAPK